MEGKFQINGLKETLDIFNDIAEQIGDKKARSKILIPAVKMAMKPVLYAAKQMAQSNNTGLLSDSLRITGRRPTAKDKKSQYVTNSDSVIAYVITKPIPRKLKKKFSEKFASENPNIFDKSEYKRQKRKFMESFGHFYDARAVANEFGTANRPAKPFLRPALEYQQQHVVELLKLSIDQKIRQYSKGK